MRAVVDPAAPARESPDPGAPRHPAGTAAKQKSPHASEHDTARIQHARVAYWQEVTALDPCCVTFVDATGVHLAMTRLYGRAPRGDRDIGAVPQNYGANVTMLAVLGSHGVEAVMTIDGAADAEVFRPTLRPGDIVRMDNLRAHKGGGDQRGY